MIDLTFSSFVGILIELINLLLLLLRTFIKRKFAIKQCHKCTCSSIVCRTATSSVLF